MTEKDSKKIREPIVEELLYPGDPTLLKEQLIQLGMAISDPPGSALGILTPHAAYDRCGSLIARAFRSIENRKVERAILIGPVHRDEEDVLILPESKWFRTPLGSLAVDTEWIEALFSSGTKYVKNDIPHLEEHCIEVQLPFLYHYFPKVRIIPILIGKPSISNIQLLSYSLKTLFTGGWGSTLLIVTSNGSKVGTEREIAQQSNRFEELIQKHDWRTLVQEKSLHRVGACGIGGIGAILQLFGSSIQFKFLEKTFCLDEKEQKGVVYHCASLHAPN